MNVLWQLGFLVLLCGAVYVDGSNCSASCFPPPDNTSLACNTTTGDCDYGCYLGFAGTNCSVNCSENCAIGPNTNHTAICDSVNRTCLFGCKYGFTGENCTFTCPQNCAKPSGNETTTCDVETRNCTFGCNGSFAGNQCEVQCPQNCKLTTIKGNDTCNVTSGNCLLGCNEGYAGPNCSFACPSKCGLTPKMNAEMCDNKSGDCLYGCIQGYSGANCSHQCPENCSFPPNNSTTTCEITTDRCTFGCKYGYSGDNCSFICPNNCGVSNELNTTTCDSNTSECLHGCQTGYAGQNCSVQCPVNCLKLPDGNNSAICNATSGHCQFGCTNGFYGPNCTGICNNSIQYCDTCHQETNGQLICSRCGNAMYVDNNKCTQCSYWCANVAQGVDFCNQANGECTNGCKKGRRGRYCTLSCETACIDNICEQYTGFCTKGCSPQSYCGTTCLTPCSEGCTNRMCEMSCTCVQGCNTDYWGLSCDERCPEHCNKPSNASNVCERALGHCIFGCSNGTFWDGKCTKPCSANCIDGICQQNSGNCSKGCINNKVHGDNCDQNCSSTCVNGTCMRLDGYCMEGCVSGKFGNNCDKNCSAHCIHGTCMRQDGHCEDGCKSGWFGNICDKTCSAQCINGRCERVDGNCSCETGFHGPSCRRECNKACFSQTCDQNSGNCSYGCISGYEGEKCDKLTPITPAPLQEASEFERKWIYVAIGGGCAVIIAVLITIALITRKRRQIAREKRKTLSEDELLELARRREHKRQRAGPGARLTQIFVENPLAKMMQVKTHDRILNTKFRVNEILEKIVLMDFGDFSDEFDRLPNGLTRTHEVAKRLDNLALNFYHGIYPYDENRVVLKRSPDQVIPDVTKRTGKSIKSRIAKSVHFFTFGKDDDYVTMGKETQPRPPSDKPLKSALKHSTSVHSEHEEKPIVHAIEIEPHVVDGASIEEESSGYSDVFSRNKTKVDDNKDDVNPYDNESFDAITNELDEAVRTMNNSDYDRVDKVQDKSNKTSAQSSDSGHIYNHTETEPPGADNAEYALVHKTSNDVKVALNPSGKSAAFSKKGEKGAYQNLALSPPPSVQDSMGLKGDYINASFIKVHKDNHKFIAAQAPAKVTVVDFWLMIWEQRVQVIVMVADIPEDGFSRCEKYWPEKGQTETFDEMKITSVTDESLVDYSVRKLNLCMHGVEREVVHLQFKAWPEDGCPVSAIDFIKFHQKYRSIAKGIGHSAPIVVHCTAGVGRTGVFIGLDVLFEEGRDSGMIDVFKCVERLREQRVDMVHSVDQYEFLYKAVAQTFALECVPYNKTKVPEKLSDLKKFDESGISRLEGIHEKMRISLQLDTQEIPTVDPQQERGRKDRPTSDIPDVIFRAHLPHNAYINAFMFDSLRDKESIVVTQMPTPDTLTDFCQLLLHQHIGTIVMLNAAESNDKTMGFYWPKDKTKEVIIGTFKMTILDVNKQADFVIRKLKLESIMADDDDTGSEINMIQYKGWKVVKNLPSAKNLLKILLMAKKYAIVSADKKMLVHCLNGSDQSGLFCALYSLLETLDLEDEVSITTIVRKVLARRPGAIPTPNQLEACFATAIEYLTQKY